MKRLNRRVEEYFKSLVAERSEVSGPRVLPKRRTVSVNSPKPSCGDGNPDLVAVGSGASSLQLRKLSSNSKLRLDEGAVGVDCSTSACHGTEAIDDTVRDNLLGVGHDEELPIDIVLALDIKAHLALHGVDDEARGFIDPTALLGSCCFILVAQIVYLGLKILHRYMSVCLQ